MVDVIQNIVDEGSLLGLLEELSFSPSSGASTNPSVRSEISIISEIDETSSVDGSNIEIFNPDDDGEADVGVTSGKKNSDSLSTSPRSPLEMTFQKEADGQSVSRIKKLEQDDEEQPQLQQQSQDEPEGTQPQHKQDQEQEQREQEGKTNGDATASVNDIVLELEILYPKVFNFINEREKHKKHSKVPEMILLHESYSECTSSNASAASDDNDEDIKETKRRDKQERKDKKDRKIESEDVVVVLDDDDKSGVSKSTMPKDLHSISSLSTRTTRPRRSRRGRKLRRRKAQRDDADTSSCQSDREGQTSRRRRRKRLGRRNTSTTSSASSSGSEGTSRQERNSSQDKKADCPPPPIASGNENRASSMPVSLTIGGSTYEGTYSGDLGPHTVNSDSSIVTDANIDNDVGGVNANTDDAEGWVTNSNDCHGDVDGDSKGQEGAPLLIPNGVGIIRFTNRDMYMGEMLNGEMHGQGTYIFASNDSDPPSLQQSAVLRGEFVHNLFWS